MVPKEMRKWTCQCPQILLTLTFSSLDNGQQDRKGKCSLPAPRGYAYCRDETGTSLHGVEKGREGLVRRQWAMRLCLRKKEWLCVGITSLLRSPSSELSS